MASGFGMSGITQRSLLFPKDDDDVDDGRVAFECGAEWLLLLLLVDVTDAGEDEEDELEEGAAIT